MVIIDQPQATTETAQTAGEPVYDLASQVTRTRRQPRDERMRKHYPQGPGKKQRRAEKAAFVAKVLAENRMERLLTNMGDFDVAASEGMSGYPETQHEVLIYLQ